MREKLLLVASFLGLTAFGFAQQTFPVNGVSTKPGKIHAFVNSTLHVDPTTTIEKGTLIIKDNQIVEAGAGIAVPKNAVVVDLKGKHIYAGFIDLYTDYGVPEVKDSRDGFFPQYDSEKKGPFNWNQSIRAEVNAAEIFSTDDKKAEEFRKLGFGAVLTHQSDGISRGTGALVSLNNEKDVMTTLLPKATGHWSFQKGRNDQTYPSSLMGSIALLKQTFLDARWYKTATNRDQTNLSLQAINDNTGLPQIFEAHDKYDILRANLIAKEFGMNFIYKTGGDDYQRINELAALKPKLIIPVDFPEAFDVSDPYDAQLVALDDLKHWEQAPSNAVELEKKGIDFAFTSKGLKEKKDFWKNLRKALKCGLSEQTALKALTTNPASFINAGNQLGALKKGYLANFVIADNNLFENGSVILENWIQGKRFVISEKDESLTVGKYDLKLGQFSYPLEVKREGDKLKANIQVIKTKDGKNDTAKAELKLEQVRNLVNFSLETGDKNLEGIVRANGTLADNGNWNGKAKLANGDWINFEAVLKEKKTPEADTTKKIKIKPVVGETTYPNMAYGRSELPVAKTMLFKNATVWTNEKDGILKNADVLVTNGKITAVGSNLAGAGAEVIDATNMHLTSGIIDEHSHIAISRGVNEGGQAISAEVSISDVVNPDDINVYRQLSGGVTAAQLLHGSANPIGGQSALIKLKYGYAPEEMKIANAPKFIKFALGENVKQSNWGDFNTTRFPQTRMGVEQSIKDAFVRAKEYGEAKKAKDPKFRKDLELETLLEILNNERFITCHSYVQSEINMLMKLAEEQGFRINTFTHILEGYKVADKMAKHGANGSTFSDWWAYKYEVRDAIPYNAALMNEQGVNVCINSDDAEMARRLNQEAAKTVKYGNVSEEAAWKMVTLNPAKALHLDKRMGSIAVGKDADLVLWNDHPLSIYAKPVKTIVDGIVFYDLKEDAEMRKEVDQERERIIQLMLEAKKEGEAVQKASKKQRKLYHCDDMEQ